jgi:hypothetical protein
MANEPNKLTTADLRRKLFTAPHAQAPSFPNDNHGQPGADSLDDADAIHLNGDEEFEALPEAEPLLPNKFLGASRPAPSTRLSTQDFRTTASASSRGGGTSRPGDSSGRRSSPADPADALFGPPGRMAMDPNQIENLVHENEQLEQLMEEMRSLLQEASEQEHRNLADLSEKENELTAAYQRIKELEEQLAFKPKTSAELEEWADELEKDSFRVAQERRTMDEDRRQLRDDEEALERQMREMEVGMARERAMLARQEQELKRLSTEIQHELETIERGDGALRDRMAIFQRRHNEVMSGKPQSRQPVAPPPEVTPPPPANNRRHDSKGLFGKIFRPGEGT